jgi:hypothetical protein
MVHPKKKSGDPDYDDKVPMDQQTGKLVTAGDGRQVLLTDNVGPVDAVTGQHVSLDDPKGDELDNRPEPGGVAEKHSEVQTYTAEDTALANKDLGKVSSQEEADKLLTQDQPEEAPREEASVSTEPTTPRKRQAK